MAKTQPQPPADATMPPVRLDAFMPFHLAVVANRVSQAVAQLIDAQFNLHIPDWRILASLVYHSPCSSLDLVRLTSMDPARVSRAQGRLADLGLITVQQDPADKRRVIVDITEAGRGITHAIAPHAREVEARFLGLLTAHENAVFTDILAKLYAATDEQGGV